jgi:hypothetical protein
MLLDNLPGPYLIILYPSQEQKKPHNASDDIPISSCKPLVIWSEHRAGRRVHPHPAHTTHIHLAELILDRSKVNESSSSYGNKPFDRQSLLTFCYFFNFSGTVIRQ